MTAHGADTTLAQAGRRQGGRKIGVRPEGAKQAEITSEMIAAGCAELSGFTARDLADGYLNPEDIVVSIYRAMLLSRPQD